MRRNSIWIVIWVFVLVACVSTAVSWAAEAEEITVIGVIEKSNRVDYIVAENEKYRIIGQDFSKLIGKKLKITGKVTQGYGDKTLLVTFMEFVRN